jgi:hypothetical protein
VLKELAGESPYVFPGPRGTAMNWVQKACDRVMERAGIEDGRHHDTRRVLQTNMAEMGVPPHIGDMILNHAVTDAPKSRQHYDLHHYIPEKRQALIQWARRLTKVLGYEPNQVMKSERKGYQGKGPARRLDGQEAYADRKNRLAAVGRDLNAERRSHRRQSTSNVPITREPRGRSASGRPTGNARYGSPRGCDLNAERLTSALATKWSR